MKSIALLLGFGVAVASWYFLADGPWLALLVLSAWIFAPWGLLAASASALSRPAFLLMLAAYCGGTVWVYEGVADTSTGALGVVFLPIYLAMALGVVLLLDYGLRSLRAQH